jgi:hypothetical protein
MLIQQDNASDIYGVPGEGRFYSPFNITIDPVKRLMLIFWSNGAVYEPMALWAFDNPVKGKGMLAMMHRPGGGMDVYFQPGLTLDKRSFVDVWFEAGAGPGEWVETPMEGARFEISPTGVDVEAAFVDVTGRQIEVRVKEGSDKPRTSFALLAPLGVVMDNPRFFPLFYVYDFSFVRRSGTELVVKVGGETRKPLPIPVPVGASFAHIMPYSADLLMVIWNKEYDGPLTPLQPEGAGEFWDGDVVYNLVENDGHYEVGVIAAGGDAHGVIFTFSPPVPDLVCLREGVTVEGHFSIRSDETVGSIEGVYLVARRGDQVDMTLQPTSGWRPRERRLLVRLIYRILPFLKRWVNTYVWSATITLDAHGQPTMRSGWTRLRDEEIGSSDLRKGKER